MEGYLEIKTRKLLQSNKKYWFVLGEERLVYYNDREDMITNIKPVGNIAMSEVLDVRVAQNQRNTITLFRKEQDKLHLKVKNGQAHNWVGNIRERIFCAKEDDLPVLRKKKRKSVRSVSRTYEELEIFAKLQNRRCSRSANDLSKLLSMSRIAQNSTNDSDSDAGQNLDLLSLPSSLRSMNTSISSSSLFSGSSISSQGSDGNSKRKPRIPVSGFTGRVFLANEKKMVEKAEIVTSEDFEYIVQAERDEVLTDMEEENEVETISRNVRFSSHQDIHFLEDETHLNKKKKKNKKRHKDNEDDKEMKIKNKETQKTRQRAHSFGWGRINLGRMKSSVSCDNVGDQINIENIKINNEVNSSISKLRNGNVDESTSEDGKYSEMSTSFRNDGKSEEIHVEMLSTNSGGKVDETCINDNQNDMKEDNIKIRCITERQISLPSPGQLSNPEDVRQESLVPDNMDKSFDLKRSRVTSVGSLNPRDSFGSMTSSRIFYWKRSSTKSSRSVTISNPVQTEFCDKVTTPSDINSQIDKIANDRLEAMYEYNRMFQNNENGGPSSPPKKPLKFHINQLEMLLIGNLNPPLGPEDINSVQLLLDSLRVMQSLRSRVCENTGESLYDIPRPIHIV